MTVGEALKFGKNFLGKSGIPNPALDASLFLMRAAGLQKTELATKDRVLLDSGVISEYKAMLEKRAANMPAQYILNSCEFMSLDFYVDENTLIPRPDTEILAEAVIARAKSLEQPNILEIGAGSGCVAVSVAKYCENARVVSVDISPKAVETAKKNAAKNEVSERAEFFISDIYSGLPEEFYNSYDVIFSNPPYIKSSDLPGLPDSVVGYEPLTALDGGADGLEFYRKIITNAHNFFKQDRKCYVLFEIGYDQAEAVSEILHSAGYSDIHVIKDLAGQDRVVSGIH